MLKHLTRPFAVLALLLAIVGGTSTPSPAAAADRPLPDTAGLARPVMSSKTPVPITDPALARIAAIRETRGSIGILAYCSVTQCSGTNPQDTQCASDATTVVSMQVTNPYRVVGLLEMRWSPSCKTQWSRVTSYVGSTPVQAWLSYNAPWNTVRYHRSGSTNHQFWSYQVYTPYEKWSACGSIYDPVYGYTKQECTFAW